jgi:hypothetical protein
MNLRPKTVDLEPVTVEGKRYYTMNQFAHIVNRGLPYVSKLITRGNAVRKLKSIKIENKPLIPIEEANDFPFVPRGKRILDVI